MVSTPAHARCQHAANTVKYPKLVKPPGRRCLTPAPADAIPMLQRNLSSSASSGTPVPCPGVDVALQIGGLANGAERQFPLPCSHVCSGCGPCTAEWVVPCAYTVVVTVLCVVWLLQARHGLRWRLLAVAVVLLAALSPCVADRLPVAGEPCGPSFIDRVKESRLSELWVTENIHAVSQCAWHVDAGVPPQCCCRTINDVNSPERCLPHVVIIGAQKSGSTALFSYFLLHPDFSRPQKKEIHYFDRRPGFRRYLDQLPEYNPLKVCRRLVAVLASDAPQLTRMGGKQGQICGRDNHLVAWLARLQFTGESTPAYILGTSVAEKMAAVVPHSKLILILRNPVDRFYSEYVGWMLLELRAGEGLRGCLERAC